MRLAPLNSSSSSWCSLPAAPTRTSARERSACPHAGRRREEGVSAGRLAHRHVRPRDQVQRALAGDARSELEVQSSDGLGITLETSIRYHVIPAEAVALDQELGNDYYADADRPDAPIAGAPRHRTVQAGGDLLDPARGDRAPDPRGRRDRDQGPPHRARGRARAQRRSSPSRSSRSSPEARGGAVRAQDAVRPRGAGVRGQEEARGDQGRGGPAAHRVGVRGRGRARCRRRVRPTACGLRRRPRPMRRPSMRRPPPNYEKQVQQYLTASILRLQEIEATRRRSRTRRTPSSC